MPLPSIYKVYGTLTTIQSASAVVFSTFVTVHGAQITVAAVGGPDMANRWLLLGRPFYQDEHMEGILITGAAAVHLVSGLAKAAIRWWYGMSQDDTRLGLFPYHRGAGYALLPFLWVHYDLMRTLPVRFFGDSAMLDFSYVAWGLQNRPVLTYGLHVGLVGLGVYHIVSGASLAYKRTFRRCGQRKEREDATQDFTSSMLWTRKGAVAASVSLALLSALIVISRVKKIPLRFEYQQIYSMLISWVSTHLPVSAYIATLQSKNIRPTKMRFNRNRRS